MSVRKSAVSYCFFFALLLIGCEKEKSGENNIIDFYFPNRQHEVRIEDNNIVVMMFDTQPVDNIVPVIEVSKKASISPGSHVARDFSNTVTYTVTAENGDKKIYTVKISRSSDNELISFSIPNRFSIVSIDATEITVDITKYADVSQLTPIVIVSEGAFVDPPSGSTVDFTEPVIYTVTALDGSVATYTITVNRILSSDNELISLSIPNITYDIKIEESDISVDVYRHVDISKLTPIVTVSEGATIDPPSSTTVDFTNPVIYTVTAQDGSAAEYTVTITKSLSRRNDIEIFELIGTQQIFEREGDNLFVYVPYETDITNISTDIVISDLATASPASGEYMDFTNPQIYTVTASDGASKDYLVTVKRSPWRNVIKNGEAPFIGRDLHQMLVYKDKLWLLGGFTGGNDVSYEVWNTEDGKNWNLITDNANWGNHYTYPWVFTVFKDKLWAVGTEGVFNSEDGAVWVKQSNRPWPNARYTPSIASFNGKIWLMGGTAGFFTSIGFNDIWSSEDGVNWTREVEFAAWPDRAAIGGSAIAHGYMYIIGGGVGNNIYTAYNDVWRTTNGVTWQCILRDAPWERRMYHAIAEYNGVIYVIAGTRSHPNSEDKNDAWKSVDGGISWEQIKHSFWLPRHAPYVVGYKGKLWMTCGSIFGNLSNEVWSMDLE